MNPCPCGNYGDPEQACTCSTGTIADLAGCEQIGPSHLAEAPKCRPKGMMVG
jgi:predicted ATPase with chaperone activity